MKKEYTIRRKFLSVLLGTLIVVCLGGCGKDTAYYMEATDTEAEIIQGVTVPQGEKETAASTESAFSESADTALSKEEKMLYVYVCGEIKHPGVYSLPEGSRIIDLFTVAGGLTKKAAGEYWNQAQLLEDGQMYYVPTEEEAKEQEQAQPEHEQSGTDASVSDGKININTASKEQLMTIPGIGAAKAEAILRFRQEHGGFSTIEDIKQVEGIKDGVFEKIKNYIKIS